MKHRAIAICQRRWMLLCTFFTLYNIALIGKTEAYTKYRCHFPKFLEVPEGWSVQYNDGSHKALIEKGKLDAKTCVPQCQEFVRYCQEEKENGKYVVSHVRYSDILICFYNLLLQYNLSIYALACYSVLNFSSIVYHLILFSSPLIPHFLKILRYNVSCCISLYVVFV